MALTDEIKQNDVVDINLSETKKQRFRIDGDNDRIIELNTSDMNIIKRLNSIYPKLNKLANDASIGVPENLDSDESIEIASKKITEIDEKMRNLLNELFDSDVASACAPYGSMFDLFNGQFRFEIIVDRLGKLYGDKFRSEIEQANKRIKKHTSKYTKK